MIDLTERRHPARRALRARPRPGRAAPRHRLRDPADRAVPPPHRRGEHRHRAAAAGLGQGADRGRAWRSCSTSSRSTTTCATAIRPALRRPAPARRRGPRPGRRPAAPADGRALRRDRPDHARAPPGRVPAPAAARSRRRSLFVTHDIDEAISLGDRVAMLRDGRQRWRSTARPQRAAHAPGRRLRRGLRRRGPGAEAPERSWPPPTMDLEPIPDGAGDLLRVEARTSVRTALSEMLEADTEDALVVRDGGEPLGRLSVDAIGRRLEAERTGSARSRERGRCLDPRRAVLGGFFRDRSHDDSCVANNGICPRWAWDHFDRYLRPVRASTSSSCSSRPAPASSSRSALALVAHRRRLARRAGDAGQRDPLHDPEPGGLLPAAAAHRARHDDRRDRAVRPTRC